MGDGAAFTRSTARKLVGPRPRRASAIFRISNFRFHLRDDWPLPVNYLNTRTFCSLDRRRSLWSGSLGPYRNAFADLSSPGDIGSPTGHPTLRWCKAMVQSEP